MVRISSRFSKSSAAWGSIICLMYLLMPNLAGAACDVQQAFAAEWMIANEAQRPLLDAGVQTLNALQELMNSPNLKDDRSVGEQFTPAEAQRFTELTERQKALNAANLIESKRIRDIRALERMYSLSHSLSKPDWQPQGDMSSEDTFLVAIILALRDELPKPMGFLIEASSPCGIESALWKEATATLSAMANDPRAKFATTEIDRLQNKYRFSKVDASRLDATDREIWDTVTAPALTSVKLTYDLVGDVARLQLLERTSERLLLSWRNDLYQSPGDPKNIGTTWRRIVEANEVPAEQIAAASVIVMINDKIPPDFIKSLSQQ